MKILFPDSPEARLRRDRVLSGILLALLLLLVLRAMRKPHGVLERNQQFGARFLQGRDPYFDPARGHRIHGPYPPSLSLAAAPLSLLPTPAARLAWASLQGAVLLGLFFLLRRWARTWWPGQAPHASVFYGGALLLASRFLLRDTAGGGGNLLYAALAAAGLDLHFRGREKSAGLPIALGLVLKPNLAPLLLFFLVKKKYKTLLSALGGAALLAFLPGLLYGMGPYLELWRRWAADVFSFLSLNDLHHSILVPDGMPPAKFAMNQCLREAIFRLFRPPGDSGAFDVHWLLLSPTAASWLARGLGLFLLGLTTWTASRHAGPRGRVFQALAFFPLALLLSPVTWKAHHAALLPLFFVLLLETSRRRGRPLFLPAGLALYYLACDLASQDLLGKAAKNYLQALSVVTWFCLALLLATLYLSRRAGEEPVTLRTG